MLKATIQKNDKTAYALIATVSLVVFIAVVLLKQIHLDLNLSFDVHIFAKINAIINSTVSVLLMAGLYFVKAKKYQQHKTVMLSAILLSVLFLLSYIAHHLLSGSTPYGGEGWIRPVYFFILITHVVLAGIILPFILLTAYRSLTGEFAIHKKLARITFPIWLYVSITGVIVYLMIAPYYT
jgi:putative membrane protein